MAPSAVPLAYGLIVVLAILLIVSILQVVHATHVRRRIISGVPSAPISSVMLVLVAASILVASYTFDIAATSIYLVSGSSTPPPTGAHLALVVCATALGKGIAPGLVFLGAFQILRARAEQSVAEKQSPKPAVERLVSRVLENILVVILPILVIIHLGIFSKAMLSTPISRTKFYSYLNAANTFERAAVVVHGLLLVRAFLATLGAHRRNLRAGDRDLIVQSSLLYSFIPAEFFRTVALFAILALSSTYSTPKTPASSAAIQLASAVFCGVTLNVAIQCLLGAAMRPAGQWQPEVKNAGEQEVADGTVPGDHVGGRKRADSIPLSPTKSNFSGSPTRLEPPREEEVENPFADPRH